MKLTICIVLCALTAAVKGAMTEADAIETLRYLSADCIKEIGANDAAFDVMIKNVPATDMETKCLRACVMKKVNVLNADGKLDKANALKIAEMHIQGDAAKMKIAHEVADACDVITVPDDHCEAGEMYKMCMFSEAKKHGIDSLF